PRYRRSRMRHLPGDCEAIKHRHGVAGRRHRRHAGAGQAARRLPEYPFQFRRHDGKHKTAAGIRAPRARRGQLTQDTGRVIMKPARMIGRKLNAKTKYRTPVADSVKAAKKTSPPLTTSFPVVGIGASAGGLEAFTRLLQR